jgi:hypothetical protein
MVCSSGRAFFLPAPHLIVNRNGVGGHQDGGRMREEDEHGRPMEIPDGDERGKRV